jgi:Family of unknown function (DUF6519)
MKGDFSRLTFDPRKHYVGVLHQQGRVWLDSDWNEDIFERLAVLQKELCDVIGSSGVPSPGTAFQISPSTDPAKPDNFRIAGGHCYVDGILCQLDGDTTYFAQPDLWDPPSVPIPRDGSTLTAVIYLEVWQRLITYLEDDSIREIALGGPDTSARLKTIVQIKVAPLPSGNDNADCGQSRKFLPGPGSGALTTLQPTASQSEDLCKLPDPANFTGRKNHLYRIQIHDSGDVAGDNSGFAFTITLGADANATDKTVKLSSKLSILQAGASLRAGCITISDNSGTSERVQLASIAADNVTLNLAQPLKSSYAQARAASVTGGIARFKWSRDNAAFAVGVQNVQSDGVTLTLAKLGRDAASSLRQGDLVEIADDASELGPARGHLTYLVSDPDPDQFTAVIADALPPNIVLDGNTSPPSGASARHLILRRWDGVGDVSAVYSDAGTPGMNLGDGVHIQFAGADLRAGDYWNFAARTADGSVEALTNAPPAGIKRSWAPLAVVSWGLQPKTSPPSSPPAGGIAMTRLVDCRNIFPSLINFPQAERGFHITGVSTISPLNVAAPLLNDTSVEITSFAGINVQCDAAVDPASISTPACAITADVPFGPGTLTVTLAGVVGLDSTGTIITWRPASPAALQTFLNGVFAQIAANAGILTRFVLKGNFIWSQNDPTLFLDGDAFGSPFGGASGLIKKTSALTNNTAVSLPSGDRRRGGDFEMWFWLVAAPSFIIDMQAAPSRTIYVGDSATVTVTLSAPAPAANPGVALTLDNANLTTSPTSPIPVTAGSTSTTFTVTGAKQGQATITAVFGPAGQSVSLVFTIAPLPDLTGALRINPPKITRGDTATGTLTLTGPAPSHGTDVTLTSSDTTIAQVPATVTVQAGNTTLNFTINSAANSGTATITAKAKTGTQPLTAQLTVVPSPKDTKDQKDNKDAPDNKQTKDTKDTKDQKESKDTNDKTNKDNTDNKQRKDSKDAKDRKEGKEGKETNKEITDRKFVERQVPAPFGLRMPTRGNAMTHTNRTDDFVTPPTAQTFILPHERPPVGQDALSVAGELERDSGRSRRGVPVLPSPSASADNSARAAQTAAEPPAEPGKTRGRKRMSKKGKPRTN